MRIHGRYVCLCLNLLLRINCAPPGVVRTVRTLRGGAHDAHPPGGVRTISKSMHLQRIWLKIRYEYTILACKTTHDIQKYTNAHSWALRMFVLKFITKRRLRTPWRGAHGAHPPRGCAPCAPPGGVRMTSKNMYLERISLKL